MLKHVARKIVKNLITGLVIGLISKILLFNYRYSNIFSATVALLFIAAMSIYDLAEMLYLKRKYGRITEDMLKGRYEETIEVDLPLERAYEICLEAVNSLGCKIQKALPTKLWLASGRKYLLTGYLTQTGLL